MRRRLFVATALVICCAPALAGGLDASAQTTSAELDSVRDRESDAVARIRAQNARIDSLLGEVTALRGRESDANAELSAAQAELDEADAEIAAGEARLRELRAELTVAVADLEVFLVDVYKTGGPDMISLVLGSSSFEELVEQTEYIERYEAYESSIIDRVRELRAQVQGTLAALEAERERIERARDAAAARRDELAAARADLEQRRAELATARDERRATLRDLRRREGNLVDRLTAASTPQGSPAVPAPAPAPGGATATIGADGRAIPPASAPPAVKAVIESANEIVDAPYRWGGGHGSFESDGYDCSGAISYALHGGGFLSSPLDSTGFMFWGEAGAGSWITVYAHSGHAYAVIAGLRWDTSGTGGTGPSWLSAPRSPAGFAARHPAGY